MADPIPEVLAEYLDGLVPERSRELQLMEADAAKRSFPIVGPAAGQFCYLMGKLIGARAVFELGSGYGYSTAWFARAVRENGGGVVHHTVWDAALSLEARRHLETLGLAEEVTFHVSEAVETLRGTGEMFDIIFNDIEKAGYPAALPVIKSHLRPGGLLITDNLLWHGRVFDQADRSEATAGVREFTSLVGSDPDWTASLIPIRDGLLVARRN